MSGVPEPDELRPFVDALFEFGVTWEARIGTLTVSRVMLYQAAMVLKHAIGDDRTLETVVSLIEELKLGHVLRRPKP